jgi:hypothetical protein
VVLLAKLQPVIVNRDLNGRVRLIVRESAAQDVAVRETLEGIARSLSQQLAPHAFAAEQMLLFEEDPTVVLQGVHASPLPDTEGVVLVDRLASEGQWARIAPLSPGAPRIVFFSIKGGVGRSTAMAVGAMVESIRRVASTLEEAND